MARRATDRATLTSITLGLAPALVVSAIGVGAFVAHESSIDEPVSLSVGAQVTLIGHGFGHGRGMGQYGAFGYAKKGWKYDQILDHYYGGTTAGKTDKAVTVALTRNTTANVRADAGMRVGGQTVAPGQAVRLSGTTATVTAGCGGAVVRTIPVTPAKIDPINIAPNRPANEWLRFCGSDDAYRGSIGLDGSRTVNIVGVDDYVKGVTPKESPARWADQGGAEALKAQAVAARTYALAATDKGKKIDDTMMSQVYGGAGGEDPRTNVAADATAGQIRVVGGQPAFTEFSSSTGGYTAGVNFPAVVDDGDTESPNHNWTTTVGSSSVAAAFGVGSLTGIAVVEANGLGPDNGRATKVRISGTSRTVEATGDDVRTKLKLRSAWFTVQGQPKPRIVAPPAGVGPGSPSGTGATAPGGVLPSLVDSLLGAVGGGGTTGTPTTPGTPAAPSTTIPGEGAVPSTLTGPVADLLKAAIAAIDAKIAELGGPSGLLGQVLGPVITIAGGAVQKFAGGNVYFSPTTGAHVLAGGALKDFVAKGAEGALGFPSADAGP
ncbi:SpoIID/LytB domain-containing protein [Williamsia sp.]|uniref:SpoIID/LytB domain-containing protein n=1 Tax=Williamsia sp. TaxID=1872085 RepID=UPI001A2D0A1A|nr:SpoIID/LytB domain-containing protein [Williamsia sp.]MBJ7291269.1 SpoIID/LytB domain-containing protein [Williamsia sp.]